MAGKPARLSGKQLGRLHLDRVGVPFELPRLRIKKGLELGRGERTALLRRLQGFGQPRCRQIGLPRFQRRKALLLQTQHFFFPSEAGHHRIAGLNLGWISKEIPVLIALAVPPEMGTV